MLSVTDLYKEVHWFNFPNLKTKPHSNQHYSINKVIHQINKTTPIIIFMLNNSLKELHHLVHDDVDYLNNVGIDIYLYEPIISYYKGKHKKTPQFYHEYIGNEDVNLNRSKELDSINLYATRNNLTNVTVHTCDYDIEKYYPHYSNLNLICDDLFLKTSVSVPIVDSTKYQIERKFLSLNRRYTTHRHMIAAYLQNYSSYVSWQFKCDFETLSKNLWFDIEEYRNDYMKQYRKLSLGTILLDKNTPLNLDHSIKEPIRINKWDGAYIIPDHNHNVSTTNLLKTTNNNIATLHNKSFVSIVNESRFAQPTGNYSEKVLHSVYLQHPFILVAPPYTLKYMREQGLKTFSDFWDESYDEESIHSVRMAKILKLIDYIGSKSLEELEQLRVEMKPILKYNLGLLKQSNHYFNLPKALNPIK
jgi:hypothetical protein